MKLYKLFNKRKVALLWLATGLILCTLLIFPTQCRNGATNGIFLSIQVLIPSLLPFLILSSFMVNSGLLFYTPKIMGILSRIFFGLPEVCFGVIVLSVIGGYPVGASGIKALYKEGHISQAQAKRMAMFCVSAGPGFLVTYIGAAMTRNLKSGYILFVSQVISVIILGIIARFAVKVEKIDNDCSKKVNRSLNIKEALVNSVNEGINCSLKISALVILFGSVTEIFMALCASHPKFEPLVALLEITNGIKIIADRYPLSLISFLCGFGGLCVHFQIFSQLEDIFFSKSTFYIFRTAQAILCGLTCEALLYFYPVTQEVISTVSNAKPEFDSGITGSIFLFITCLVFLISVKSLKLKNKPNKT